MKPTTTTPRSKHSPSNLQTVRITQPSHFPTPTSSIPQPRKRLLRSRSRASRMTWREQIPLPRDPQSSHRRGCSCQTWGGTSNSFLPAEVASVRRSANEQMKKSYKKLKTEYEGFCSHRGKSLVKTKPVVTNGSRYEDQHSWIVVRRV